MEHRAPTKIRLSTPARVLAGVALVATLVPPAWLAKEALGFGSDLPVVAGSTHTGVTHDPQRRAAVNTGQVLGAGPISELDKELLVKVRQANLWELPAGRLAQTNSSSDQVRRAGLHLIEGHSRLDQIVREISVALGVPIPNEPSEEQQAWVRQLKNSKGEEFDKFFANQLRNAHGKVFVVVAQVRSTTQNSVIRDLAIEANLAVSDHLEVLEDTGLVEPGTFEDVEKAVVRKQ